MDKATWTTHAQSDQNSDTAAPRYDDISDHIQPYLAGIQQTARATGDSDELLCISGANKCQSMTMDVSAWTCARAYFNMLPAA
jgi:hypothetical protein